MKHLHDEYRCISPVYKGGVLYAIGDSMFLPAGKEYKGHCFVLVKKADVPKKPKKETAKKAESLKKKAQSLEEKD